MLTMEMVLHKDVDFAPKFGKNPFFKLCDNYLNPNMRWRNKKSPSQIWKTSSRFFPTNYL